MTPLITIIGAAITVVALFVGLVWLFQERIAFQPPPAPAHALSRSSSFDQVHYITEDNQHLLAYVVGRPQSANGLLLCFHGNADLAINGIAWAETVVQRTGFAVMLAEYRGYMNLGGRPSYIGSRFDSDAAYNYARKSFQISPQYIAFYGHSLGTAVATELALRHLPACLVLESPFTSARDMVRLLAWSGAEKLWTSITRLHFDTEGAVASIDSPVWVAHGGKDRLIPPEMGRRVFAAAKKKGSILIVPDAAHNDVAAVGGDSYWRWMESALDSTNKEKEAI